jgi:hypothetical protein
MRVARFVRTAAVISCIVGMVAMPASAAAPTLAFNEAVRTGTKAVVGGTAAFPTITQAVSVGGTNTNFARAEVAEAAGINMTDAKIQPLADGSGLRFMWVMSSMPEQTPPEGVRYTWAFKIGETLYQLQAKRTNMAILPAARRVCRQLRGRPVGGLLPPGVPQRGVRCRQQDGVDGSAVQHA